MSMTYFSGCLAVSEFVWEGEPAPSDKPNQENAAKDTNSRYHFVYIGSDCILSFESHSLLFLIILHAVRSKCVI